MKQIVINEFPTHAWISSNKAVKINGQKMYSGMNHFTRDSFVNYLRVEIAKFIPTDFNLEGYTPLQISMEWWIPPNFETVKMKAKSKKESFSLNGGLVEEDKKYDPRFDVDNQWIWIKCFTDVISKDLKLIPEDTVKYIPRNGGITFVPVFKLEDRKIIFKLERIEEGEYLNKLKHYFNYDI